MANINAGEIRGPIGALEDVPCFSASSALAAAVSSSTRVHLFLLTSALVVTIEKGAFRFTAREFCSGTEACSLIFREDVLLTRHIPHAS